MKKIIFILLLLLFSIRSFAYDFEIDGIYYNIISNNEVEVTFKSTSDRGYSGVINIPSSINYNGKTYRVTAIGEKAFENCSGLTGNLLIPNSVTSIGYSAFYRCSGITGSLIIPNSVTYIGGHAFEDCSGLTGLLTISNSIRTIEVSAFMNCRGITDLTLPNSVVSIGEHAFYGCRRLSSLTLPNSVVSIGEHAFSGCTSLTGSLVIPSSVASIGLSAFQGCVGIDEVAVESGNIFYDSRNNCNAIIKTSTNELLAGFKNTIIPNTVTSICQSAFMECNVITSINIPNSITTIGQSAFDGCI